MFKRKARISVAVAAVSAALAIGSQSVCAQQYSGPSGPATPPPSPPPAASPPPLAPPPALTPAPTTFASGLELIAYPYLWLAGINMAISTPLQRAPQVDVSKGAGQIIGGLNNAPFMGAAELRYGRFGIFADALHLPLGFPITTPHNIFFSGGNSSLVTSIVTGDFLYRVLDQPAQTIDGGLGFRWWGQSADTTLNGRLLPTTSVSEIGSWADPLLVARYHRDFGNGFGLTAYGDVGGFGIGAHVDWQITGTLDYRLKPWLDLHLGYRSLNVNYQASGSLVGFNVHIKGPLLGATLRF